MTDDEMRIAIAEAEGWTKIRMTIKGAGAPERRPSPHGWCRGRKYEAPLPNYLGCLNAMHEAEKVLDGKQRFDYINNLANLTYPKQWSGNEMPDWYSHHATAKQRAEAFCRTLFPERFK